jgi:ketosteroid isomerase-like protein
MRQWHKTLASVLCFLAVSCAPAVLADAGRESGTDRERIARVIDDSIGWFETKDFDLLFSTMADDPDLFMFQPGSTGTIHGFGQFKEFSAIWRDPDTKYGSHEIRELRIHLSSSGEVAWFSAILEDCGEYKGQVGCWEDTRWTGVLERRDGRWVIMQMHFSFAADKVREKLEKQARE